MREWQHLLIEGADIIDEQGWAKGAGEFHDGSVCAVFAIEKARKRRKSDWIHAYIATRKLAHRINIYKREYGIKGWLLRRMPKFVHVVDWNDDSYTNANDVIITMRDVGVMGK